MSRRSAAQSCDPSLQPALFAMTELHQPAPPRRLFTALFPPADACAAIDAERQRWQCLPRRLLPVSERRAQDTVLCPLQEPIHWTVHHVDLIASDLQSQPPRYHRLGRFPA